MWYEAHQFNFERLHIEQNADTCLFKFRHSYQPDLPPRGTFDDRSIKPRLVPNDEDVRTFFYDKLVSVLKRIAPLALSQLSFFTLVKTR